MPFLLHGLCQLDCLFCCPAFLSPQLALQCRDFLYLPSQPPGFFRAPCRPRLKEHGDFAGGLGRGLELHEAEKFREEILTNRWSQLEEGVCGLGSKDAVKEPLGTAQQRS